MVRETNLVINKTFTNEEIKNLIHTVRGKQVMLDSDVASLFNYTTKDLNRNVKNNKERFPQEFCFQLTNEEYESLRCKIFTLNKMHRGQHRKYLPFVFTEHGITMLAGMLKSPIATELSIKIVNTFIEMRNFLMMNGQVFDRLTNLEYKQLENEKNFEKLFGMFIKDENIKQRIFFEGQIYDAYNLLIEIIMKANKKITIIDNYIDNTVLKMLAKKRENVEVVVLTSNNSKIDNIDIQKFNKQYPILKIARTTKFHDRFIIVDNKELYHCGASLKDAGKKCFAISKVENNEIIDLLNNTL